MKTSFYIQTFGCQMNVADTEQMKARLRDEGMMEAREADEADVILVNGCSVREKAVHKAVSALGRFQFLKKSGSRFGPYIGLGGCVGQLDQGKIFESQPWVDFVFGPDAIDQIPEMIYRLKQGERRVTATVFDEKKIYETSTRLSRPSAQAFVNIMKGCDKYCTYCIVPFTRGREKSRTIDEVVEDVAQLVSQGVREITLLGQNVNSFGKGNTNSKNRFPQVLTNPIGRVGPDETDENFPQLLLALEHDPRLASLKRIRFTSSHPLDFSDQLIESYAPQGLRKLARHLHLPVQSGSNRILQKMGRHHKIENYISQMERLKSIAPDVAITTDIIVGFPGETDEDFQETVKLVETVGYESIFAFSYSVRPGTRAAKLVDDVPDHVKNERLQTLLDFSRKVGEKKLAANVGRRFEVLVEGPAKNQAWFQGGTRRLWSARTSCNSIVLFETSQTRDLTGHFFDVEITATSSLSMKGVLVEDPLWAEVRGLA